MSNIYSTLKIFSNKYPSFPEASLRYLIFNADSNGLNQSGAIIRIGRKILIDENAFFDWIKSSSECLEITYG